MGAIRDLGIDPLSTPGKHREVLYAERLNRLSFFSICGLLTFSFFAHQ